MKLFEQRFKQYLTEGSQFGYNMEDENTFLGWDIDNNVQQNFPNVYDHLKTVLDTYDRSAGSAADIQDLVTISALRDVVDEQEVNDFVEYAEELTSMNKTFLEILENYGIDWSHVDFQGVEAYADISPGEVDDLEVPINFVFGADPLEITPNSASIQILNDYQNGKFNPYISIKFQDTNTGEEESFIKDFEGRNLYTEFANVVEEFQHIFE